MAYTGSPSRFIANSWKSVLNWMNARPVRRKISSLDITLNASGRIPSVRLSR